VPKVCGTSGNVLRVTAELSCSTLNYLFKKNSCVLHMKACMGGVTVWLHPFLTSAPDVGKRLFSFPGPLNKRLGGP